MAKSPRGALSMEECPHCPSVAASAITSEHTRSVAGLADRDCPHYWEHLAIKQGNTINRQGTRIRELIRERDIADSKTEAAYDLAEQYARNAGEGIARHDTLGYVEEYWRLRGDFERTWTDLESFRWEMFQVKRQLDDGAGDGSVDSITARELAAKIAQLIGSLSGGTRKRAVQFFARPAAPVAQQPQLLPETA